MDNRQKEIDNLKDYKYGFSTDIESTRAPKGLNENVIKFIRYQLFSINFIELFTSPIYFSHFGVTLNSIFQIVFSVNFKFFEFQIPNRCF